jgi:hypothetical protein
MPEIEYLDGAIQGWETVEDGVEKIVLRAESGENRVLLRIAGGKGLSKTCAFGTRRGFFC